MNDSLFSLLAIVLEIALWRAFAHKRLLFIHEGFSAWAACQATISPCMLQIVIGLLGREDVLVVLHYYIVFVQYVLKERPLIQ